MPLCIATVLRKQLQGSLRLYALLASSDQGAVSDYICHHALQLQCVEQLEGSLRLHALIADADQRAVGDYVRDQALQLHCVE